MVGLSGILAIFHAVFYDLLMNVHTKKRFGARNAVVCEPINTVIVAGIAAIVSILSGHIKNTGR